MLVEILVKELVLGSTATFTIFVAFLENEISNRFVEASQQGQRINLGLAVEKGTAIAEILQTQTKTFLKTEYNEKY